MPESTSGVTAQVLYTLLVETDVSLTWGLHLGYTGYKPLRSSCFSIPNAGMIIKYMPLNCFGFFWWFLAIFVCLFFGFVSGFAWVPLCSPSCPRTFYVDQGELKLDCTASTLPTKTSSSRQPELYSHLPRPKKKS